MQVIVSRGDGQTWLFHTELRDGRWAKWNGSWADGVRISSLRNPADKRPGLRWEDFSPMFIGEPGMIAFSLNNQLTLDYVRAEFPAEWRILWDAIEMEYESVADRLTLAAIRFHDMYNQK
ncbi:hypothetical protein [Nocardia altamirensis]|uniref:hypothetical protein n=1 Tax=Nocardia altamirensis TaxID=472158 RepID=UPI001C3F7F3D|nr:hypothetical protein [Nocardia altamirensis]